MSFMCAISKYGLNAIVLSNSFYEDALCINFPLTDHSIFPFHNYTCIYIKSPYWNPPVFSVSITPFFHSYPLPE